MIITIQIPESITERTVLAGLSPAEVNRYATAGAVAYLTVAADAATGAEDAEIAEIVEEESRRHDAGDRVLPLPEACAHIRERLARRHR